MMAGLRQLIGNVLGARDAGVAVPAMDGPYKPNTHLEDAERLFALAGASHVLAIANAAYCAGDGRLYRIDSRDGIATAVEIRRFGAPIAFLAEVAGARLAVGVAHEGIHVLGADAQWRLIAIPAPLSACMTAAAALADDSLALCIGSTLNGAADWKRDLMEKRAAGLVLVVDLTGGGTREIASGLAYPNGVLVRPDGALLVSESWRHRLVQLSSPADRHPSPVLSDLPGYPGHLAPAPDGGLWLALFAPRRQLFEFLLSEDGYRRDMMATIPPDEWIGPDFAPSDAPAQPLQQGSVRQMGQLKPWAPSRSYGLVIRCDSAARPLASWHSRADGTLHGITATSQWNTHLLIASRGACQIARLAIEGADHD